MSMKPKIILTEEVTSQIMEYESKRDQLTMKRTEIEDRFNMIQQVVQENAALEQKAKKLIEQYQELLEQESVKRKQYFPEIRLGILQKIVEFIGATPPADAAGGSAPAGDASTDGAPAGDANAVGIPPESKTDQPISSGNGNSGSGDAGGNSTPTA
jgi:hypothetical protein